MSWTPSAAGASLWVLAADSASYLSNNGVRKGEFLIRANLIMEVAGRRHLYEAGPRCEVTAQIAGEKYDRTLVVMDEVETAAGVRDSLAAEKCVKAMARDLVAAIVSYGDVGGVLALSSTGTVTYEPPSAD